MQILTSIVVWSAAPCRCPPSLPNFNGRLQWPFEFPMGCVHLCHACGGISILCASPLWLRVPRIMRVSLIKDPVRSKRPLCLLWGMKATSTSVKLIENQPQSSLLGLETVCLWRCLIPPYKLFLKSEVMINRPSDSDWLSQKWKRCSLESICLIMFF